MKTKIIIIAIAIVVAVGTFAFTKINKGLAAEVPLDVKGLESMAEKGDTAAMHQLLRFYDENAVEFVEVAEVYEPDGTAVPQEEVEAMNEEYKKSAAASEKYAERLEYWLEKGLAIDDPVANYIKGMHLYYADDSQSMVYLAKAADGGNAQAALFCGSACYNNGRLDEAIKYHQMAYDAGLPSAGWHLAMCYVVKGGDENIAKAIDYLRHSAMLNHPEAVLEMKRIDPANTLWQHKADSLDLDFTDFPIIPVE